MQISHSRKQEADNSLVKSYLSVRSALGGLGLALPVMLFGGALLIGETPHSSMSAYYYGRLNGVFVGTLCAIAVFLWSYLGYQRRVERNEVLSDRVVSRIAALAALGVALVPCNPDQNITPPNWSVPLLRELIERLAPSLPATAVHYASATVLFSCFGLFSLVLFRRSEGSGEPTAKKISRNRIYLTCGVCIFGAMALLMLLAVIVHFSSAATQAAIHGSTLVFWLETVCVGAFSVSWLVKGERLVWLND